MSSPSSKNIPVDWREIVGDPVMFLAFGFGSGLIPKAPGTAGTIVAIPIAVMLSKLPLVAELTVIGIMFISGIWICNYAANKLGVHDHSGIVWDEIVGYAVAVIFIPHEWLWWLLGFALFRLFDIVKPWPIRELDHSMSGGLGIMLDDIVAGVFAFISLALITWGANVF